MKADPMTSIEEKDKPKEGFRRPILLTISIAISAYVIGTIVAKML